MTILFLHGWQSTPGGVKPTYLKSHSHEVLNPSLPDDDFDEAVRIVQEEFDRHHPDVVVGSSRGGAVAMNIRSGETPLVLLCPAWKRWGTATTVKPNTVILHSPADEVVPFADSQELLRNSGLPDSALIVVGTDHRLADPPPLKKMLETVERARIGLTMKLLNVQIQPERVPELDEAEVVSRLTSTGSGTGLVQHVEVTKGNDDGHYTNVSYATHDLPRLWTLLRREVLEDARIGPILQKAAIVVCQGDNGWDDYLLLHHFDDNEPFDSL
jgi:hypothetical protein